MGMELRDYLKALEPELRERLAAAAETTVPYLYQLAGGHRAASANLCVKLEQASEELFRKGLTGERITREDLRPEFFVRGDAA